MSSDVSIVNFNAFVLTNSPHKASPYFLHLYKDKYKSSFELVKAIEINSSKKVNLIYITLIETNSVYSKSAQSYSVIVN